MRIDTSREAAIHYRCGSSGSGKSWGVKEAVKDAKRLLVFDPDDEYGEVLGILTVYSVKDLIQSVKTYPRGGRRVRLVANGQKAFEGFCKVAFAWCNCVVVAEEIAGVTTPTKAPEGWHTLITRGRKRGVTIYAVTQRPAEADKTVIGNATTIRAGRLSRAGDRQYVAREMDLPVTALSSLNNLEFVECNMANMSVIRGQMGTKRRQIIR